MFFPLGHLLLPIQDTPPGLVTWIDSRPLADFLKVNSMASPSFGLQKPSMCSLLWCTKTSTGGSSATLGQAVMARKLNPMHTLNHLHVPAPWKQLRLLGGPGRGLWHLLWPLGTATCKLLVWHGAHGSWQSPRPRAPGQEATGPREVQRQRGGSENRLLHLPWHNSSGGAHGCFWLAFFFWTVAVLLLFIIYLTVV